MTRAKSPAAPETPLCPQSDRHTPHPAGYVRHSNWADQMLLTHGQHECSGCGRWEIWKPKDPAVLTAPAIVDLDCASCGTPYDEGDLIRTDGNCGWIASRCCPETAMESIDA